MNIITNPKNSTKRETMSSTPILTSCSNSVLRKIADVLAILLLFLSTGYTKSVQPQLEWSVAVNGPLDASPIPYPLENPNGVIVGTSGHVIRIDGRGKIVFNRLFGPKASIWNTNYEVSLVDLDGDGKDEIISGVNDGYVYALNASDGSTIWKYNLGTKLGTFRYATPTDLDSDGNAEILVSNMDGWLFCLDAHGKLLWRFKSEPSRISSAAVADINNDGSLDIVFGTCTNHIVALDNKGRLLWDHVYEGLDFSRTRPLIVDADKDGKPEIYSMSCCRIAGKGLISLNAADGKLRWMAPLTSKAYFALVAVDLDQDGVDEIIAADKGTAVAAFSSRGQLLWRTFLKGRGIWTAPAVADIDGDGSYELVVTVRDASPDSNKYSWYVLDASGKVKGSYRLEGGAFGAPLIADIDHDNVLEVVIASRRPGRVTAYNFGGTARKNAILASFQRSIDYNVPRIEQYVHKVKPRTKQLSFVKEKPVGQFGENHLTLSLPHMKGRMGIELSTLTPNKKRYTRLFLNNKKASRLKIPWFVFEQGEYRLDLRLFDLDNNEVLGTQSLSITVFDPVAPLQSVLNNTLRKMERKKDSLAQKHPEAEVQIGSKIIKLKNDFILLKKDISTVNALDIVDRHKLAAKSNAFLQSLDQCMRYTSLLETEIMHNRNSRFVVWQDTNPWDNSDPANELPAKGGPVTIQHWAFGNEIESVCFNIASLSHKNLTLRVEPGTVKIKGQDEKTEAAQRYADLYRVVVMPSRYDETVPDLLAPMAGGYLIDLAPGQVQQLWINVNTKNMKAGHYIFSWDIRTLDQKALTIPVSIDFNVSTIRLPEKSRYAANFWAQIKLGSLNRIADLNEHLQTVWSGIALPAAKVNEKGEIVGALDWAAHDATVSQIKQIDKIFYHLPALSFPKGVQVGASLKKRAQKNYAKKMMEHLRQIGLSYNDFVFYPQDEPGLTGSIDYYMKRAKEIKSIDPNFLVYADPTGAITIEMIKRMVPYTDVWQPSISTIRALGQPYIDAMRSKGKPVWTYDAPDRGRMLKPLGFYRALPWIAFDWGLDGGGYWTYHYHNFWNTLPEKEPEYGAVAFDGREVVPSRRWEATRDGIEDFNMLCLVRDKMDAGNSTQASSLLNQAVRYVAGKANIAEPRDAFDYEIDYVLLQKYRTKIRDMLENSNQ